jgi:putative transposase
MRLYRYTSDLTDCQWEGIKSCILVQRRSKWDLKEVVNAILYLTKQGCTWRDIPSEFPPWQTVYWYFSKWTNDGIWEGIAQMLVMIQRRCGKRDALASAVVLDGQSVKNSSTATDQVGVDGGKSIKGRKRLVLTDMSGNVLFSVVIAANRHDGVSALGWWRHWLAAHPLLERVRTIYADRMFAGVFKKGMEQLFGLQVIIPDELVTIKGNMKVHKKRWVVERSLAWLGNSRRLSKDYERSTASSNAFISISTILRLRKFAIAA